MGGSNLFASVRLYLLFTGRVERIRELFGQESVSSGLVPRRFEPEAHVAMVLALAFGKMGSENPDAPRLFVLGYTARDRADRVAEAIRDWEGTTDCRSVTIVIALERSESVHKTGLAVLDLMARSRYFLGCRAARLPKGDDPGCNDLSPAFRRALFIEGGPFPVGHVQREAPEAIVTFDGFTLESILAFACELPLAFSLPPERARGFVASLQSG